MTLTNKRTVHSQRACFICPYLPLEVWQREGTLMCEHLCLFERLVHLLLATAVCCLLVFPPGFFLDRLTAAVEEKLT